MRSRGEIEALGLQRVKDSSNMAAWNLTLYSRDLILLRETVNSLSITMRGLDRGASPSLTSIRWLARSKVKNQTMRKSLTITVARMATTWSTLSQWSRDNLLWNIRMSALKSSMKKRPMRIWWIALSRMTTIQPGINTIWLGLTNIVTIVIRHLRRLHELRPARRPWVILKAKIASLKNLSNLSTAWTRRVLQSQWRKVALWKTKKN